MTITWSIQQQAIFEHFENGAGNLVIVARAGTGKTTTVLEGTKYAPERRILFCAFNKKNAVELGQKLTNPNAEAKTLHSLGLSFLRLYDSKLRVEQYRGADIAKRICQGAPEDIVKLVAQLASKAKGMKPHASKEGDLIEIAMQFDLVPDEEWEDTYPIEYVERMALEAMDAACDRDGTVDFDDMIFLPVRCGLAKPRYDMVIVDECQDMNAAQIELARKACRKTGRIVVVGDDRQCHPAGTMIELTGGQRIPIEQIEPGMQVVTYHDCFRGLRTQGRKVLDVGVRRYNDDMLTVTAGNENVKMTVNHRVPTRLIDDGVKRWALYLMETGNTSRIGCCQLMYSRAFGPAMRARQERADRLWVLEVFADKDEAHIAETLTGLKFGLPERVFFEKGQIKDRLLEAIGDNNERARRCLEAFGRRYEFPLYAANDGKHIGRYMYITEACNLLDGVNTLRTFAGTRDGGVWERVTIKRVEVSESVYSLSVEPTEGGHRLYVADRVLVHNCIYAFRGADPTSFARLRCELDATELKLTTTYRCPKKVVKLAASLVPDYEAAPTAPEGTVRNTSREKMLDEATEGDFILSRKNAPLASICLALLKRGKRAKIEGRDIGAGLRNLVKKLAVGHAARSMPALLEKLSKWEEREVKRAKAASANRPELRAARIEYIKDQAELLYDLSEGLSGVSELVTRLNDLFADGPNGSPRIVCSSVHRAKGMEAPRVYVLEDTLMMDKGLEEQNIGYVAYTRAQEELVFAPSK